MSEPHFRKGQTVTVELRGAGVVTTEERTVLYVRKGQVWLDSGPGNDPTGPFNMTGCYLNDGVPGFSMSLRLEES